MNYGIQKIVHHTTRPQNWLAPLLMSVTKYATATSVSNMQSNIYATSSNACHIVNIDDSSKQFNSRTRSQIRALWIIHKYSTAIALAFVSNSGSCMVLILSNRPHRARSWCRCGPRWTKVRKVIGVVLVRLRPRCITNDKTFRWTAGRLRAYWHSICRRRPFVLSYIL